MMQLITSRAMPQQISEIREEYDLIVKLAVDIEQKILVGGGEFHADCEQQLLANGSDQENIWGANWFPELKKVVCESMINLRPLQNNPSMFIINPTRQARVIEVIEQLLGGL